MFFSQGLSFLPGSVQRLLGKNIYWGHIEF